MFRLLKRLLLLLFIILFIILLANSTFQRIQSSVEMQEVKVVRIVDGDTIIVNWNFEDMTIRLIGIDTPESVHPDQEKNTKWGDEASEHTKDLVKPGNTVYLQKDKSDKDRYGRYLRYVWLKKPRNIQSSYQIRNYMLNAVLVDDGYALPKRFLPDTKYSNYFDIFAEDAKTSERGLWADEEFRNYAN